LPFYADGRLLFAAIKKCLARLWSLFFLDVFKSRQDISGVGFIWGAENGAFEREFCYGLLLVGMD